MTSSARGGLLVLVALAVGACAPGAPGARPAEAPVREERRAGPTLVLVFRSELDTLAAKPLGSRGIGLGDAPARRLFNAGLVLEDGGGLARPYLAESLPELRTDTWRVFPDGRMETTYRLKPNLSWHDGAPLSAHDFVFAWRVYATPQFGTASSPPLGQMEQVVAADDHTVVIHWQRAFPYADRLNAEAFQPLPRHLLQDALEADAPDTFTNRAFWTEGYVGPGPYRLDRWEAGAFIEGVAFKGHVLGTAKIDRIRLRFLEDSNTVLANLLAGEAHATLAYTIYLQQAVVLRREWGSTGGSVLVVPAGWRKTNIQNRPELVNPRGLLDVRVRKALAYGLDKQAVNDGLFEGEGVLADTMIPPGVDYHPEVDRAIVKYLYDPRRSEQLMVEAGFSRGPDGAYTSAADGRFVADLRANATADLLREVSIMASQWREAGFDIREVPIPLAQARDGQVRATFSALQNFGGGLGEAGLANYTASAIPTAENRWSGSNQGAWVNAEYDRLFEAFSTTLDRADRIRLVTQMTRIFTEQVAAISLHYSPNVIARVASLTGLEPFSAESTPTWNVHQWAWREARAP